MAGLPSVTEKADGTLELGLPETIGDIDVEANIFSADEAAVVRAYLSELDRQHADHMVLEAACTKVISAYKDSMDHIEALDRDEMRYMKPELRPTYDEWLGDKKDDLSDMRKPKAHKRSRSRPDDKNERASVPTGSFKVLKEWLYAHQESPYPTALEKDLLLEETGLSMKQLNNFMINGRRRYLKKAKMLPTRE